MRGRFVGAALGIAIAACFDKPPRPEVDGGGGGGGGGDAPSSTTCTSLKVIDGFDGSGSGSTACGSGNAQFNGGGSLIDSNGLLVAGTGANPGGASCTWTGIAGSATVGTNLTRVLHTFANDETYFDLSTSTGTCQIGVPATTNDVRIAFDGVQTGTVPRGPGVTAYLRFVPQGAGVIGQYSADNTTFLTIGNCGFGAITGSLTVAIGITFDAGSGDSASFDEVWTCP